MFLTGTNASTNRDQLAECSSVVKVIVVRQPLAGQSRCQTGNYPSSLARALSAQAQADGTMPTDIGGHTVTAP